MRIARCLIYLVIGGLGFLAMFLHALATRGTGRADAGGNLLGWGWALVGVASIAALYEWAFWQRARRRRQGGWSKFSSRPSAPASVTAAPPDAFNHALHLAMEWGSDFGQPTQPRMRSIYPKLTDTELDALDAQARAVMQRGEQFVRAHPTCSLDELSANLRTTFPWLSDENARRLHAQAQYYAMK